jgi:hypothetical protein
MLGEGFGFDKYAELTTEYRVKGEFAITVFVSIKN